MSFYSNLAKTAARLIKKYGQEADLSREIGGEIDPLTGEETAGTPTTYNPYGILKSYPDNLIDGTRIQSTDKLLILDDTIEPLLSDRLVFVGSSWTIQEIITANPAGTPLVYFVQVRR